MQEWLRSHLNLVRLIDRSIVWVCLVAAEEEFVLDMPVEATRFCSIAVGKLHVHTKGLPISIMGQHDFFVIGPGAACTVANEMTTEAVLHIVSWMEPIALEEDN